MVAGAIAWIGGGGSPGVQLPLIAARDYAALLSIGKHGQALGTWLFMPASLVTIGFGVAMVATESTLGSATCGSSSGSAG